MNYIQNGPNIPENLEHALRNDNLVFFCGAGISVQNSLPLFKCLVKQVCQKLNINIEQESLLQEADSRKDYDGMLDLIEGNPSFSVSRKTLRKEIIKSLSSYKGNPDIHKVLLDLSALPGHKGHRLVTTNFDRLFFEAGLNKDLFDSAPKLAPPRKETWQHLTFLHGVIDEDHDPEGKNLILTRRDFGLAYLYDNWASRFIIQLFQDWTVLFIGYGVNDPVMKYLVSAISYENQRRKENSQKQDEKLSIHQTVDEHKIKPSIYAFAKYREDQKKQDENKWRALGVEPILYKVKGSEKKPDHSLLYNTIKEWASLKRTGLSGKKNWFKKQLEAQYNKEIDKEKANNVISALKIDKKLIEYFPQIDFDPDPKKSNTSHPNKPVDISWLDAFDDSKILDKLIIPKTSRFIRLGPIVPLWEPLSSLEDRIAWWLCYHLDKKELIHWVINKGCILHPQFKEMILSKIEHKKTNNRDIPPLDKRSLLFWKTITQDSYCPQIYNTNRYIDYHIITDLNKEYCPTKAKMLLEILEPYIYFHRDWLSDSSSDFEKLAREPEIKITVDYYPDILLKNEEVLLLHAEDFSDLLKKAMEVAKKFEIIKNGEDYFSVIRPSIAEHPQNTKYYPWTYLIDLVRDSFDIAMKKDKQLANLLLQKWQYYPYSLFYRLILYAVTEYPKLDEKTTLDLLANKKHNVLWSMSCQNEVCKYLKSFKNRKYSSNFMQNLLDLIVKGPPDNLFKENIDKKLITESKERDIYKRLNCLKVSEVSFSKEIKKIYHKIQSKYYSLQALKSSEIHDFPYFHTGVRSIPIDRKQFHNLTPEEIFNIIKKLKMPSYPHEKKEAFHSLTIDHPDKAFEVLLMFSEEDKFSVPYWESFFYGICESKSIKEFTQESIEKEPPEEKEITQESSNEYFVKALQKIEGFSDEFITKCLESLVYAWEIKSGLIYYYIDRFYFKKWWERLWKLSIQKTEPLKKESVNSYFKPANSKSGKLVQVIFLILWNQFKNTIPKSGKIPKDIQYYFNIIKRSAETNPAVMFHFGTNLYALWLLDKEWTNKNIKPLMDWDKHKNICYAIWNGYTYHMDLGLDFLINFKDNFLQLFLKGNSLYEGKAQSQDTIKECESIAELFLITTGGKWFENIFTDSETNQLKHTFIKNTNILESLSRKIWILLKDSKDKSANLWGEKIEPWIEKFWPRQKNMKTSKIAQNLSSALLYCGDKFPEAIKVLEEHIKEIITENNYTVLDIINGDIDDDKNRFNHIFKYPHDLLTLLNWNFPQDSILYHCKESLQNILHKLKEKHPDIERDEKYIELNDKIQ